MPCECSKLEYGAKLVLPLECKKILGPFDRDFVLLDVVFDLYTHPNGDASKAGGKVWNALPGSWSRLLVGDWVGVQGRQYHFESGVLCPEDSYLSICSSYFVNEPTALLSARVMGCYCEEPPQIQPGTGPILDVDWKDAGVIQAIDPMQPTGRPSVEGGDDEPVNRKVLRTATETIEPGELRIKAAGREISLAAGSAAAFHVERPKWDWTCEGMEDRTAQGPSGTNLVVARRTSDGRLIHWVMYEEQPTKTKRTK